MRKKINARLSEIGYSLLTENSEDGEWEKILNAYNKMADKKDIFEASVINKEDKVGLKQKCKVALSSNEEKDYELAKRWCVKEETMKDMLTRNKHSKLNERNQGANKKK